jgi:glycosyltransferase involved in cell wall biosynthesis
MEHAMTGSIQVVPDHSACKELFHDVGRLIPTSQELCFEKTLTFGKLVTPQAVAEQLQWIYDNPEEKAKMEEAALEKFTSPKYSWQNIAKTWHNIFREIL